MNRLRDDRGQTVVLTVVFVTALLAMTGFVLDLGSWYRAQRHTQATADAAALAAAQVLPHDPAQARSLAMEYGAENGGGITSVTFSRRFADSDTVTVVVRRDTPGLFARLFDIDSVNVGAKASALATGVSEAKYAAPIGVDERHPLISGGGCPCFGQATELELGKVAPGGFRLINVDGSRGGTGPGTLAEWILRGLDAYMPLGWYYSDPGAKFDSSEVKAALDARIGHELLFPVYRSVRSVGSNAEYDIVGWIGFVLTGHDIHGKKGKLFGHFTRFVAHGLQGQTGNPDYGVRAVSLVE